MSRKGSQSLVTAWRQLYSCCLIGLLIISGLSNMALAAQSDQGEIQAQLETLREQKKEIDGVISSLASKPAQLQSFQKTLVTNYKYLAQQKLRLKGIRLWNGFVAFVGVAFDSLQKVNPGTSLVTNIATFVQDRAVATLPNPPLQAKITRLSAEMNALGPALRQLDRALTMTPDEVADLMVARGMVDDVTAIAVRWDGEIRLRATPEALAKSAAVITGKTTFILERMGAAMRALYQAKGATAESIVAISEHLANAKRKSRELGVLIAKLEGQIQLEETREEIYEPVLIKEQPETSLNNVPPKAPGQAFMEVQSAWNDLKTNFITGKTYKAVKMRMGYAASAYVHQQLSAEREELQQASDYVFYILPEIQKNTSDRYTQLENQRLATQRLGVAKEAFFKKQAQLVDMKKKQFDKPFEKHQQEIEPSEVPRFEEFCTRMEGILINNPVTSTWLNGELEIVTNTETLENINGGDYMAGLAWGMVAQNIKKLRLSLVINQHTDQTKYPALARDTLQKATSLLSGATVTASQLQTIAMQAQDMASELEANLNLWQFLDSRMDTDEPKFTTYTSNLPSMKVANKMFTLEANILRTEAQAEYDLLKDEVERIGQLSKRAAKRQQVLAQAKNLVKNWQQIKKLSSAISPNQQVTATSAFLQQNNLNRERIEKLKKVVTELDKSPKGLEAYALREVSGANNHGINVPNNEQLQTLQEGYRQVTRSVGIKQRAYTKQYVKYQQEYAQLEQGLYAIQSQNPSLATSFSIDAIMAEAGQQVSMADWVLPEPDSLPTPDPADDALIKEFVDIATNYNQLLDPYRDKANRHYTTARQSMAVLANKPMTTAVLQPDITPEEFEARIAALVAEAAKVYAPLAFLDEGQEKTDLGIKYQRLLDGISRAKKQYLMFWENRIYQKMEDISTKLASDSTLSQEQRDTYQQELTALIAPGSFADQRQQEGQMSTLIAAIQELLEKLAATPETPVGSTANDTIMAFYDNFKQAYEAKNEALVMSFIADDWTAAGGVTLLDLEDNLSNMYNVFDDIEYSLSELSINSAGQNVYDVSYSVTIRGTIFDNDLTHEEASSVNEQIVIDGSGKPKIKKTLGGNYWSIQ